MPGPRELRALDDDLWVVDDWQPVGPGVVFPTRMVVLRLPDGGLWLHSPLEPDDDLAGALAALGPVRWLVEPNLFHHLHAPAAQARWPDAELVGVPGHERKQPGARFGAIDDVAARWKPELETLAVEGIPPLGERVFFHRPSATLIVCDLVFHIRELRGWLTPLLLRVVGAHGRLAQSRSVRFMTRDRAAAARSARAILDWPCERLVVSHGETIERGAQERLRQALSRMQSA